MKSICLFILFAITISCNTQKEVTQEVEISCGQCQFNLKEGGCDLAVRFDNKSYFVDGFHIDDFGDAHDQHKGFCNAVRKAKVTGFVKKDKFIASAIELTD